MERTYYQNDYINWILVKVPRARIENSFPTLQELTTWLDEYDGIGKYRATFQLGYYNIFFTHEHDALMFRLKFSR